MTENHHKKLFLLDAMALIYRAYFAFGNNHRYNSKGQNTSAILGFTNTLLELLKKEKPTHIAVVFDTAAPTVRHIDFTDYKANREEMPEDISSSIPYIQKIIEGFRIPVLYSDGYEADDVIGTLAKKAEEQGYITYMMTPDKDYGQLVSENIFIYKPAAFGKGPEILGVKEVCSKFEIQRPEQVIDILGLMGDSVDNIPGIPGVGEKTAMKLVKEFGSVEELLQNTDKLAGKLKEKVEAGKEKAIMSKKLATIICDAPVEFDPEKLKMEEPDKEALRDIFTELEFRRLAQQVLGEELLKPEPKARPAVAANGQTDLFGHFESTDSNGDIATEETEAPKVYNTIENTTHHYFLADTKEKREELIGQLKLQNSFCFDTETTGLDALRAELVGMSFAYQNTKAYYVPFPENFSEATAIANEFKVVLENISIEKVGQNLKYDISVLKKYGINVQGKLFDTMIAHYLIMPEMRHGMDVMAETYLHYSPVKIESLIGKKGKQQLSMRQVPLDTIKEYAAEDADITLQLKEKFSPMIDNEGLQKLFGEIEIPLISVLADMEAEGIKIDTNALAEFSKELENMILAQDKDIQTLAGTPFNIASPKQVGEILFEVLKIVEKPKKTKTGQYATGEDILSKLTDKHPIVAKILEYRELQKLKGTYVDALPQLINPNTGRIHTSYNQVVAVTGRLSSDNPNLQNIPIRTEKGREIRKAFVPRNEEYVLLSADYSQIELRIIAELSKDAGMMEAFINGQDIHSATASKVYGISIAEVTSDMRRNAKMVNFGIIYGISAFGLSQRLGIPRKEAAEIINQYFAKYPDVKRYMDDSIDFARKQGYVETMLGRKRHLVDINSSNAVVRGYAERNAINSPIQGTAADMIKIAMINIHHEFKQHSFKSKMLLQVHDELVFDAHKDEIDIIRPIIENHMRNAIIMKVPVEVEIGIGKNWLEAH